MKKDQEVRQQISELADGELDSSQLPLLLAELRTPEARSHWDVYHRIGDVLRSEQMAAEPSAGFSRQLAARLEQEPTLLAPRRQLPSGRLRGWAAGLVAVAAASMGFLLSPSLFHSPGRGNAPATLASESDWAKTAAASQPALLADASGVKDSAVDSADYILLHQSANPSLYGAPALIRPAAMSSSQQK